ncbi:hypothetical protein AB4K20DRAFT_1867462 [Rhizopus microsporus]
MNPKDKSKAQTVNNNVDTNYGIVIGVMNGLLSTGDIKLPDVQQKRQFNGKSKTRRTSKTLGVSFFRHVIVMAFALLGQINCSAISMLTITPTRDVASQLPREKEGVDELSENEDKNRETVSFVEEFLLLMWASHANTNSNATINTSLGEYILKASKQDYRADACIIDTEQNKLCILETPAPLKLSDKCKYGYNHIKGALVSLPLFNDLFKKYYMASEDTAQRLKVMFVHAKRFASVIFGALLSEAVHSQEGIQG